MGKRKYNISVGDIFGRLTVKELGVILPDSKRKERYIRCSCACGKEAFVVSHRLGSGHTKSCGCLQQDTRGKSSITHGNCRHRLFDVWRAMVSRCSNPSDANYKHYGGRGISYDPLWESFDNFLEDMYDKYEEGLTLDREDNDGDYSKGNCRWVPMYMQCHNKRHRAGNSSKYRGVFKIASGYNTYINYRGKRSYLHVWKNEGDAAKAYDDASSILFGDRPNNTDGREDWVLSRVISKLKSKGFIE